MRAQNEANGLLYLLEILHNFNCHNQSQLVKIIPGKGLTLTAGCANYQLGSVKLQLHQEKNGSLYSAI